jgi:CRP-like cAMP-binding protein
MLCALTLLTYTYTQEDDEGDCMFFVQDGSCIARSATDVSKIYAEFGVGSFFGEHSVLTGAKRSSDIVTDTYCDFLVSGLEV